MNRLLLLSCFILMAGACSPRRGVPYTEPLGAREQDVVEGKVLFDKFCNSCHPGGTSGIGPALNNKPLPGFLVRFQIRNGVGVMPAFKEEVISDKQSKQIFAYMKALRKLED